MRPEKTKSLKRGAEILVYEFFITFFIAFEIDSLVEIIKFGKLDMWFQAGVYDNLFDIGIDAERVESAFSVITPLSDFIVEEFLGFEP